MDTPQYKKRRDYLIFTNGYGLFIFALILTTCRAMHVKWSGRQSVPILSWNFSSVLTINPFEKENQAQPPLLARSLELSLFESAQFVYRKFFDGHPFVREKCQTCAIVFPAGTLLNTSHGHVIDGHDCVIRTNDAPTRPYENQVGRRTTFRLTRYRGLQKMVKSPTIFFEGLSRPEAVFVLLDWKFKKRAFNADTDTVVNNLSIYNNVPLFSRPSPVPIGRLPYALRRAHKHPSIVSVPFYNMTDGERMRELYYWLSGQPRRVTLLSQGWYTYLFAQQHCEQISVYGVVEERFCDDPTNAGVPYHYYENAKRKLCHEYRPQRLRSHRFLLERRIMMNLSRARDITLNFIS